MKRRTLDKVLGARDSKSPAALVTVLETGAQSLLVDGALVDGEPVPDDVSEAVSDALRKDKGRIVERADGQHFIQVFNPPKRMIVVGAVHISQPLVQMATLAGYDVTLVDPRGAWATDARFPETRIDRRWPDEAMEDLAPDTRTAVVTLTHDPKLDDPALVVALKSPAFYIGALGSKRTHAKRVDRLTAEGLEEDVIGRIHGPIGLAIGAVSPAEIAISIMAEVTRHLHAAGQT